MVRYPHTLTVTWKGETTFENGMPVAGDEVGHTITGRAEANGKGRLVSLNDGSQIVYDWSFFAGSVTFLIPFGASAEIKEGDDVIWTGTVKRQAIGQKIMQIWL